MECVRTEFWDPKNVTFNDTLHSWDPNLLSSCQNLGLWLPELCFKVLNPETVSPSLTAYLYYGIMSTHVFWNIFALSLPSITASSIFILHSHSAVIKFRDPQSHNRAFSLVTGAPKPHTIPGPPILHFDPCSEHSFLSQILPSIDIFFLVISVLPSFPLLLSFLYFFSCTLFVPTVFQLVLSFLFPTEQNLTLIDELWQISVSQCFTMFGRVTRKSSSLLKVLLLQFSEYFLGLP